jgi:hypothetical protein
MKKKFDPFKYFPEEICDEIFAYLNVQDIKEASLVSKHWYNIIGRSKSCMEKICLKPKKSHQNHEFFKTILDSTRMYQNVQMIDRLNEVKKNTKYLRLMRDVVTKLAPTIVSLKLSNDLIIKEYLPKLKELEFDAHHLRNLIAVNGLLTKTNGLEKLTVNCVHIDTDQKSMKYLRNFLMENSSLKVLKVVDIWLFRGLNSSNVKFRLEDFFTDYRDPIPFDFFRVHSDSLKVTNTILTQDLVSFFMSSFPQLHTLIIQDNFRHDDDSFDVPFNRTIRKVKFDLISHTIRNGFHDLSIIKIIEKVEKLEEIEIDFINPQILRALFNCRSLETVKFRESDLTRQDYNEIQIHDNIDFIMIESRYYRY